MTASGWRPAPRRSPRRDPRSAWPVCASASRWPAAPSRLKQARAVARVSPRDSRAEYWEQLVVEAEPGSPSGRVGVVLVDDHGVVREGLRLLLAQDPGLAVLGDA